VWLLVVSRLRLLSARASAIFSLIVDRTDIEGLTGETGERRGSVTPVGVNGVSGSAKSQAPSWRRTAIRIVLNLVGALSGWRILKGVIWEAGCRMSNTAESLVVFVCLLGSCCEFARRMRVLKYAITATIKIATRASVTTRATIWPCFGVGNMVVELAG